MNFLRNFDTATMLSDIYKVEFVHNFFLENFKYDYDAYEYYLKSKPSAGTVYEHSYTALGPILNKIGFCAGFSRLFKISLDYLNVKCLVVTGEAKSPNNEAKGGHDWNIAKINNKSFHFDVTWNICTMNYIYFGLSDTEISKNHKIPNNVPTCGTDDGDYFSINSLTVNRPSELKALISRKLKNEEKCFSFKIKNISKPNKIIDKIAKITWECYEVMFKQSTELELTYDEDFSIIKINCIN